MADVNYEIVKKIGGLHRFMVWDRPILTDSERFPYLRKGGPRN